MKRNLFLQLFSIAIIAVFITISFSASAQTSKADFSGNWVFNAGKSDMGQQGQGGSGNRGFGGGDIAVTQEPNLLTVTRTRTTSDGESVTTTNKYTLDGKESINTSQRGDSKSVAAWSADGKSLTINTTRTFERDGQSMEMKSKEVWSLTSPASLSVITIMTTPNGERTISAVYDKK